MQIWDVHSCITQQNPAGLSGGKEPAPVPLYFCGLKASNIENNVKILHFSPHWDDEIHSNIGSQG